MTEAAVMDATVLIATFDRAALLGETLQSLAGLSVRAGRTWEVIVVDNNSSDDTAAVVSRHAASFPVPLRYLFESRQGRSTALNSGIAAATGRVLAMTDDDVRVEPDWLDAACDALGGTDESLAYAGGPVAPIWESKPPAWLDLARGDLWGTIAIQDHGDLPFRYDERRKVPLGANMAARRALFERVGGFRADLGRSSGRVVMGQEVPELLLRAQAAGLHGVVRAGYAGAPPHPGAAADAPLFPEMVVWQGGVARGAGEAAAGDRTGTRSAADTAPVQRPALHVRERRQGRAGVAPRPPERTRSRRLSSRNDAGLLRRLRRGATVRPYFTMKVVSTGRWSLGVMPFASAVS